ncbi:hypothetical protein [Actinoplanes regularis]|uniref:hypothetical protein n=1 Tax=Actinoplanes regularis TaxID=52697 RepID=UPI0024A05084|nr:hypothetical protein [Actinoplanes regularis]GLW31783.1 hypothetical protein Areg01_47220 [Actinoplanes regularis]
MIDQERRPAGEPADPVTERLVATLQRRAGNVSDGPRFRAADIVRSGHRARRRRQAVAGSAIMAVIGAVALTAVQLAGPAPNTPDDLAPPMVADGADLLRDNVIHRADGSRVALGLQAGLTASDPVRVSSGWVVRADKEGAASTTWFVPDHGAPSPVGKGMGESGVSPDGSVLVVGQDNDYVAAYELPSLRLLGRHAFGEGMGALVLGVTHDVAVLRGAQGDETPARSAVWDFRTGEFRTTTAEVRLVGVSDNGNLLRQVGDCVDVIPVTDRSPAGRTGLCGRPRSAPVDGGLSPDGRWVLLSLEPADGESAGTTVLLRTADLRAGLWQPVPIGGPADVIGVSWVSGDTLALYLPDAGLQLCREGQRCAALVTPAGVSDPEVVVPRDGH